MKRKIALRVLIIAGVGSPQLIVGQQLGPFTAIPGFGRVQGINRFAQITAQKGDETLESILADNVGTVTAIMVPGSKQTLAFGIDNSARIVGAYNNPDHGGAHGFLYEQGAFTTIDFPGGTDTQARGINTPKDIVGDYRDSAGHRHGFLQDNRNGNITQIDVPGAVSTYIYGINDPGTIVGYFTDGAGHQHGFLSDKKGNITTMDVPFPGATDTFLYGINSPADMVGSYIDGAGTHGFVKPKAGGFISFDAPDTAPGIGTFARSISDNDQILVYGTIAFLTSAN